MKPAAPAADRWALVRSAVPRRRVAGLGALMVLSALTEGIGLVLLVPLLGALGGGGTLPGLAGQIAAAGVPLGLGALLAIFAGLVTLRAALVHARTLAAQRFEMDVVDALRARAWRALLHCDWRTLVQLRRSDTAALLISEIDRVGLGVGQAIAALACAVTLGGIGLAALAISPAVTAAAAAAGALVLLAYRRLRRRAGQIGQDLGQAYGAVHGSLAEGLGALRVIKGLGAEARSEDAMAGGFARLRAAQLAYLRDRGRGQLALQAGGAALLAVLVWLAVARFGLGAATILPLVALFARALPLLGALQDAWLNWDHAAPALDSAGALIAATEAAREPELPAAALARPQRSIALRGVSLRHAPDLPPVLDGIDLELPARGAVMLQGPSGAGKSTLADVLGGLLTPDAGAVVIDGAALDAGQRRSWRGQVAYVQQEPVIAASTLRENLRWAAPDADDAALLDALDDAGAGFARDLPGGLDTVIGDGGRGLSGGERQRITIARALLRRPALLILDEATSALDPASEAAVVAAVRRLKTRMAVLIIAHRGALGAAADQNYVLADGRISDAPPGLAEG